MTDYPILTEVKAIAENMKEDGVQPNGYMEIALILFDLQRRVEKLEHDMSGTAAK